MKSRRWYWARVSFWALVIVAGSLIVPGPGFIFVFGVALYGFLISEWWLEALAPLAEPGWDLDDAERAEEDD